MPGVLCFWRRYGVLDRNNSPGALMRLVLLSLSAILASAVREACFMHALLTSLFMMKWGLCGLSPNHSKAKKSICSLFWVVYGLWLRTLMPNDFGFDMSVHGPLVTARFSDATGIREGDDLEQEFR